MYWSVRADARSWGGQDRARSAEDFRSVGKRLPATSDALVTAGEYFPYRLAQDVDPAVAGANVRWSNAASPRALAQGVRYPSAGAVERQGMSRDDESDGLRWVMRFHLSQERSRYAE